MKNFLKNLLSRKKSSKNSENLENYSINFIDLKAEKYILKTVISGNDILLHISNEKNTFEMWLDKEKSFLLSILLQDYVANNSLKNSLIALNEKE